MNKLLFAVLITIFSMLTAYSQPEIIENGQPSDSAKSGTIKTSGEGIVTINAYVSQISVKVKGDIVIPVRSKDKIKFTKGNVIKPEELSEEDIQKCFPVLAAGSAKSKALIKKGSYLIYHDVDDEIKLNDNRFMVKLVGTITDMIIYGIGIAYFEGDGKYNLTKEGSTDVVENEWQKVADEEEERYKKKKKIVLNPVIYGDYTVKAKAKVKPK